MNLILQIIGVCLSLTHITLNIFMIRACWLFNFAALSVWIFLYARLQMPLVLGLMVVYQVLSVIGWIKWGKRTLSRREKREWKAAWKLKCKWCGKEFDWLFASCGTGFTWSLYRCPHCKKLTAEATGEFGHIPEAVKNNPEIKLIGEKK